MILNNGTFVFNESTDIKKGIRDVLDQILNTYYVSGGAPAYDKIRLSQEYNKLHESVLRLQIFDLEELQGDNEKKAFWINLHNLLTVHGIVHFQIKLTVWERPNFFISTEYNIGGYRFSSYDIIHGILRRNRRRWRFYPPPFRGNDPRIRFIIDESDPRVHFSLHSGSKSCPRLAVYHPDSIDEELDEAARRFINSNQFLFDKQTKTLTCSKVFKWFAKDFGKTKADRLAYVSQFVDDEETGAILKEDVKKITINYMSYDWHLNSSE